MKLVVFLKLELSPDVKHLLYVLAVSANIGNYVLLNYSIALNFFCKSSSLLCRSWIYLAEVLTTLAVSTETLF